MHKGPHAAFMTALIGLLSIRMTDMHTNSTTALCSWVAYHESSTFPQLPAKQDTQTLYMQAQTHTHTHRQMWLNYDEYTNLLSRTSLCTVTKYVIINTSSGCFRTSLHHSWLRNVIQINTSTIHMSINAHTSFILDAFYSSSLIYLIYICS